MNKFWQNYFLMNEAGAEAGAGGGVPAQAPENGNPASGEQAPSEQGNQPSDDKGTNQNAGFNTGLFDDDGGELDENGEPKKTEVEQPSEDYSHEKAYESFEFQLPENYSLTDEQKDHYLGLAKEKGVKPEQLQTFVDEHIQAEQQKVEQYRGIVREWENEVKNDPVIGGDNFPKTKMNVNKACSVDGGAEFKKTLAEMGLISNPAVVRYLNNVGNMLHGDKVVTGSAGGASAPTKDYAKIYPNSNY